MEQKFLHANSRLADQETDKHFMEPFHISYTYYQADFFCQVLKVHFWYTSTFPTYPFFLHLITQVIFCEEHNFSFSCLCSLTFYSLVKIVILIVLLSFCHILVHYRIRVFRRREKTAVIALM